MHSSRMCTARSSSSLLGVVCLSACWDTHPPGLGLDTPPGCGPGHPPARSPDLPLGLGLDTPLTRPPNLPLGPGPRHPQPGSPTSHGPDPSHHPLAVNRMTDRQV